MILPMAIRGVTERSLVEWLGQSNVSTTWHHGTRNDVNFYK